MKKDWYKPKAYVHLSRRLDFKSAGFVASYCSNPETVAAHKFYPLIHKVVVEKKYKIVDVRNGKKIRKHYTKESGQKKSTAKPRQIFYANHLDAHIYSYYSQEILGPLYEEKLKNNQDVSEAVLAYRRIEVENEDRGKCNIDFANDVFNEISKLKGEITVFAFDISKFFDSLDHKILKRTWAALLGRKDLPKDHYAVYKSLINFSYVEMDYLLNNCGIKNPRKLLDSDLDCFFENPKEFRESVVEKGRVRTNPFRRNDDNNVKIGIPQGTPLSAFLANLYMLDYDTSAVSFLKDKGGIYRRYSDDILVVCETKDESIIEEFILSSIQNLGLLIQSTKTQKTRFHNGRLVRGQQPLKYLGFEYDGKNKRIRSASISKFYRNMKQTVRRKAKRAKIMKRKAPSRAFIYRKPLYLRFSHLGAKKASSNRKRNYLSYAKLAYTVMQDDAIRRQLSKSWVILHREIQKYNEIYFLNEGGNLNYHLSVIIENDEPKLHFSFGASNSFLNSKRRKVKNSNS